MQRRRKGEETVYFLDAQSPAVLLTVSIRAGLEMAAAAASATSPVLPLFTYR